jgi:hypothetical protein
MPTKASANVYITNNTGGNASVTVQMAKIIVPFTWIADIVYKSGQTYHAPYSGVFSGLTSHDISITVTLVDPNKSV